MQTSKKMTAKDLVEHLKVNKGILFNITKEDEAIEFLTKHTYYVKLTSYRANYEKCVSGENIGKYTNLEFAYLQELSRIDRDFRKIVLDLCLNIEHEIKVELLNDVVANDKEDGYNIVQCFLQQNANKNVSDSNQMYSKSPYVRKLIAKYGDLIPAWAFCETITFGNLCTFCQFYNKKYPNRLKFRIDFLFPIRDIRNAAAHSNCVICNLREQNNKMNNEMGNVVKQLIPSMSKSQRQMMLRNKPIHDFLVLIYFYKTYMQNDSLKNDGIKMVNDFFDKRIIEHKDYFQGNQKLVGICRFVKTFLKNI